MSKQDYMPKAQDTYLKWHDNLQHGVTLTTPGAAAGDILMLSVENGDLHGKMTAATLADNASKAAHKDLNQSIATSQADARKLVKRIKNSTGCTPALIAQLQIEGPEDSTDMTQASPTLGFTIKAGGVVEIDFDKLNAEGVHLYGRRGTETGFTLLASETHSPYVDNRPLLAANQPETREYKGVFFLGKAEIGLESAEVVATARP